MRLSSSLMLRQHITEYTLIMTADEQGCFEI